MPRFRHKPNKERLMIVYRRRRRRRRKREREQRRRNAKGEEAPASITDNEPKDAVQILSSGSDSD